MCQQNTALDGSVHYAGDPQSATITFAKRRDRAHNYGVVMGIMLIATIDSLCQRAIHGRSCA